MLRLITSRSLARLSRALDVRGRGAAYLGRALRKGRHLTLTEQDVERARVLAPTPELRALWMAAPSLLKALRTFAGYMDGYAASGNRLTPTNARAIAAEARAAIQMAEGTTEAAHA